MPESIELFPDGVTRLAPQTGTSFLLKKGQRLSVIDPNGCQVADLLAFNAADQNEVISNGRTFDYAKRIYLTTGDKLYSNRSNSLLRIVEDTVGRHDFLITPCSQATFRILYVENKAAPSCFGNFAHVLEKHGIGEDRIPVPFNCFMNVLVDGKTGGFEILPPVTRPGDHIDFVAEIDLVVALTACSAGRSNGGTCKPIDYSISETVEA